MMPRQSLRSQQREDEWASGIRKGGWKHTKEAKEKISKNLKKTLKKSEVKKNHYSFPKGEESPSYIDGRSSVKGYKSFLNERRRASKLKAKGSHTFGEWKQLKAQYNLTCPACGKSEPKIKLTEDHIIPLSKGGSDYIENIQPLCKSCNSIKNVKIIKYLVKNHESITTGL